MRFRIQVITIIFFLFYGVTKSFAQKEKKTYSLDLNYTFGQTFHYKDYFIGEEGQARSIVLGLNKQTFGSKAWHRDYNFPNYGLTFVYQRNHQDFIGNLYAVLLHYTHFFCNHKLALKFANGLALATNPFDLDDNDKNIFVTSKISNAFRCSLQWREENLWRGLGLEFGVSFSHYSNGKTMLRNKGLNTIHAHIGVNYSFGKKQQFIHKGKREALDKKIHCNFLFRGGVNQNITRTGYNPLYTLSFYANKRINNTGGILIGCDYFISDFLKNELIRRKLHYSNTERVGVFAGYELLIGNFSIPMQVGCYVVRPKGYDKWLYQRIAAKYKVHQNFFFEIALKTHYGSAEAIEYTVGLCL